MGGRKKYSVVRSQESVEGLGESAGVSRRDRGVKKEAGVGGSIQILYCEIIKIGVLLCVCSAITVSNRSFQVYT